MLDVTVESIERLRESLLVVRVLAASAFVFLFILGPLLTLFRGPNVAIVYVAIAAYSTAVASIALIWSQRRDLQLTVSRAIWLSVDILICPAFLPNLVRKVTVTRPVEVDGAQVLFALATSEIKEEFRARLKDRTESLLDEEVPDRPEDERLRSYIATVEEAR